jgi:hypothetical protein
MLHHTTRQHYLPHIPFFSSSFDLSFFIGFALGAGFFLFDLPGDTGVFSLGEKGVCLYPVTAWSCCSLPVVL